MATRHHLSRLLAVALMALVAVIGIGMAHEDEPLLLEEYELRSELFLLGPFRLPPTGTFDYYIPNMPSPSTMIPGKLIGVTSVWK